MTASCIRPQQYYTSVSINKYGCFCWHGCWSYPCKWRNPSRCFHLNPGKPSLWQLEQVTGWKLPSAAVIRWMTSSQDTQCGPGSDIIVSRNSFTVTLVKIVFQISGDHPPHLGLWVKDGFSCRVIVHVEGLTLSHSSRETQDVF